ncbi:hypothetical protein SAMN06272771_1014 [Streptomyces sp. Ag82_O1-12]|uniref:DUF6397 family protein n=1 Tax=unclassified Streptomyces TaxID=2593676 RepID=UPI000BC893DA|nr:MULTISPECIES: DUF6397 family protein [unclassified Streptomyces]SMQ14707.1 hypothetical protein SAMN06272771_1014 [Streptomyces sp. Ag82_O1-12]SOD43733.1 hypothetical protein SAMN06272727_1005 [Streptomyces sp. Ag82_G6-1]
MSRTGTTSDRPTCAPSRAARELGLKRGEFDLAVNLGLIRTVPDEGGGGPRVASAEIDRLRSGDGFPDALRGRVATVGTTAGAELMGVTPTRFTSLARYGLLIPVTFYLNRYRTVVWLYLAEELRQFAAEGSHAQLLTARRTPTEIREKLKAGMDRRPRNWRGRHLGFLTRQAGDDPWARAGAVACLLDPADVADVVRDPGERIHLARCHPRLPAHGTPGSPTAELAETLMTASEPDEVAWFRADLAHTMETARRHHPVAATLSPAPPAGPSSVVSLPEPPAGRSSLVSLPEPPAGPSSLMPLPAPPAAPNPLVPLPAPPTGPDPLAPRPAPAAERRPEPTDPTPPHGLLSRLRRRRRRPAG